MRKFFIGFLWVFLDFNLNLNTHIVGLIPDFIGYIILIQGLNEMKHFSPHFANAYPYAVGMTIYSGILYALDLLGASFIPNLVSILLGVISVAISLYISYQIILGIRDIETANNVNLNSDRLFSTWKLLAIFQLSIFLTFLIPVLAIICVIISFILSIIFLVELHTAKKRFEVMLPNETWLKQS